MTGIYVVSKIRHAEKWKKLREHGVPVISSWIDDGAADTINFATAWPRYLAEASSAAYLLVYVEPGDELKGGLFEMGAGLAAGATVIVVGMVPQLVSACAHPRVIEAASLPAALRIIDGIDQALLVQFMD
jgi:hypothetical protein